MNPGLSDRRATHSLQGPQLMTQNFCLGQPGRALSQPQWPVAGGTPRPVPMTVPSPQGRQVLLPQGHTEYRMRLSPCPPRLWLPLDPAGGRGRTWKIYELG